MRPAPLRPVTSFGLALLLAACGGASAAPTADLTAPQVQQRLQTADVTLIDVRTRDEFASGHIAGARHIDVTAPGFEAAIAALPKDRPYILYCRTGRRSANAQEIMEKAGFRQVQNMQGGIIAWTEAGLPTQKPGTP